MPEPRSLALSRLVKDNEMLSEMEVASVVAPLIERLRGLHAAGRAHGNVSLATVAIRVVGRNTKGPLATVQVPWPS